MDVERVPNCVGHRGRDSIVGHGVPFVEDRLRTSQKVVPVDRGSRRDPAHSNVVITGRDDAGNVVP